MKQFSDKIVSKRAGNSLKDKNTVLWNSKGIFWRVQGPQNTQSTSDVLALLSSEEDKLIKVSKISLCHTLKNYKKENLLPDILTGMIIAAVSIPISMGYAQIAGLPAVYGLYGSVFPIIVFGLLSTSKQFVFGVDAAPAALVGAALVTLGVTPGTEEAMRVVPVITFFTAIWLLVFFLFRAGKLVNYISTPVMGGFISGICTTIILMQVPKLYGAGAGTGELFELVEHIAETIHDVNVPSVIMGLAALAVLLISRRFIPKFPMAICVMALGAVMSCVIDMDEYGIVCLSEVSRGLPSLVVPQVDVRMLPNILTVSLSVAVVIMAETLLAENNFAQKNRYRIDDNQELLAFGMGNLAAAFTGCCPINGSVSRTTMSEQYGGRTQLTGIVAGLVMIVILVCGTGFIGYLPVPVLTAIVISALYSALEFDLAARLWKVSKVEFYIFCGAFLGVLILGTINGVLIGIILSFAAVIRKAADPPRSFLGLVPGHEEFLALERFKHAYPIQNVVIYRFSSNLFFANTAIFQKDIMDAVQDDTKAVIVDASAMGSVDVTAAKTLRIMYDMLKEKGVKLYITEHIGQLNVQLRQLGLGDLIESGCVRQTMERALSDCGLERPYPLVGVHNSYHDIRRKRAENMAQELVWAFGDDAEDVIEKHIRESISSMKNGNGVEQIMTGFWRQMDIQDEEEWLEHMEAHIEEIVRATGEDEDKVAERIERRRRQLLSRLETEHPELVDRYKARRKRLDEHLKEHNPAAYEVVMRLREREKNSRTVR